MTACIALVRGINVGRANRVAMADLRAVIEGLGHTDVRTLLNSGNVVFQARRPSVDKHARAIEAAFASAFGFSVSVVVLTATDLASIVQANPLRVIAKNPTRYFVGFVSNPAALAKVKPLLDKSWGLDVLAIGAKAAYLWCAEGLTDSKLMPAFARAIGAEATTRNWATVLKLHAAAGSNNNAR